MRYQSNRASCGPASLHNALAALGIHRTEDELAQLCKQTPDGTSVRNLGRAIQSISTPEQPLRGDAFGFKGNAEALVALWYYISYLGRPCILAVDHWEHWVTVVGHLGTRFSVVDSANNALVLFYNADQLSERWLGPGPKGGYYGLIV